MNSISDIVKKNGEKKYSKNILIITQFFVFDQIWYKCLDTKCIVCEEKSVTTSDVLM